MAFQRKLNLTDGKETSISIESTLSPNGRLIAFLARQKFAEEFDSRLLIYNVENEECFCFEVSGQHISVGGKIEVIVWGLLRNRRSRLHHVREILFRNAPYLVELYEN